MGELATSSQSDTTDVTPAGRIGNLTYASYIEHARSSIAGRVMIWGAVLVAFVWGIWGTGFGVLALIQGLSVSVDFIVSDLMPPRLQAVPDLIGPTLETLYMSYVGMVGAVVISLPLAILAARNTTIHIVVSYLSRATTTFVRSVPDLVLGILLVVVFGLGAFAGTLALMLSGVGILGKAYADGIEEIDPGQIEGLRATGASWLQVLGQGVWPQFKPTFIAWSLYKLDLNIRNASVLGLVGAGGLGHALTTSIDLFRFRTAAAAIIMIFVLILFTEFITGSLRRRAL